MLDQSADLADCIDECGHKDAKTAKEYNYLSGLDWFVGANDNGLRMGNASFIDGCHPGNEYLTIASHDPPSASLLQARLQELGLKISVQIMKET